MTQAPSFNFELGPDEILAKALEVGFVTEVGPDKYLLNEDYIRDTCKHENRTSYSDGNAGGFSKFRDICDDCGADVTEDY